MKQSAAIIPIRSLENSKLRLRHLLSDQERATLTAALIWNILNAVEKSKISRAIVVASDPKEIGMSPQFSKLSVVRESSYRGGVNSAMQDGLSTLEEDTIAFLMPSDLPLIDSESLDRVYGLMAQYDMVLNGSRREDGTSLLVFSNSKRIPLHYDDNSFRKHAEEAKALGLRYVILDWEQFSFDVDDEHDLRDLMEKFNATTFDSLVQVIRTRRQ